MHGQRLRVLQISRGAAAMTNLQEGAKHLRGWGAPPAAGAAESAPGYLLSAVVVVRGAERWSRAREGQTKAHALRAREGAVPALRREQRLRQLKRGRRGQGQQADLLQLICRQREELSTSSSPSVYSRGRRARASTRPVRTTPNIRGQGARPETAAPTPSRGGSGPRPPRDPLGSPGPSKSSTLLSPRAPSPLLGSHAGWSGWDCLVVQSNLNLSAPDLKRGPPRSNELKLTLSAVRQGTTEPTTNKRSG